MNKARAAAWRRSPCFKLKIKFTFRIKYAIMSIVFILN